MSETPNDIKIDDGMHAVLDCVLENIDGLLTENIPSAAANPSFCPLPTSIATDERGNRGTASSAYHNNNNRMLHNNLLIVSHHQNASFPSATNPFHQPQNMMMMNDKQHHHNTFKMSPSSSYNSLASLESAGAASNNNESTNILLDTEKLRIFTFVANECIKFQIKNYVFISKDCTQRLSEYIVREEWGRDQGLLYKYIDYIFRCQAFKRQMIVINNKYLVFHTGLQRRSDKQFLYALLVRNKKYVAQKWRVSLGNIKKSFCTKAELLNKLPQSYLCHDYLPKKNQFYHCLSDLLYDESYTIQVNWEERLTTNKDRIHRVLGNCAFFDTKVKFMKLSELIEAFAISLERTQQIAQLNPRLAVAQVFVDKKKSGYRLELLLPLIIEFPASSSNFYMFALAMHKTPLSHEDGPKYVVKSILTIDMAYSNARIMGYVDSNWLRYGKYDKCVRDMNDFF